MSVPGVLSNEKTLIFEQCHEVLDPLGLSTMESLVSVEDCEIVLPMENHQGNTVHVGAGVQLGTVQCSDIAGNEPTDVPVGPVSCNAPYWSVLFQLNEWRSYSNHGVFL